MAASIDRWCLYIGGLAFVALLIWTAAVWVAGWVESHYGRRPIPSSCEATRRAFEAAADESGFDRHAAEALAIIAAPRRERLPFVERVKVDAEFDAIVAGSNITDLRGGPHAC